MRKSKGTEKPESLRSTPATSKNSLKIEFDDELRAHIRSLSASERKEIGAAIDRAAKAWGKPHAHTGSGIRKLTPKYFESRIGLERRLIFKPLSADALHFVFMGSHDEVRRFIKTIR